MASMRAMTVLRKAKPPWVTGVSSGGSRAQASASGIRWVASQHRRMKDCMGSAFFSMGASAQMAEQEEEQGPAAVQRQHPAGEGFPNGDLQRPELGGEGEGHHDIAGGDHARVH